MRPVFVAESGLRWIGGALGADGYIASSGRLGLKTLENKRG